MGGTLADAALEIENKIKRIFKIGVELTVLTGELEPLVNSLRGVTSVEQGLDISENAAPTEFIELGERSE